MNIRRIPSKVNFGGLGDFLATEIIDHDVAQNKFTQLA